MEIGDKIRMLREQKGFTLEQLGNMVGVGKSTVRKWETGQIANMRRDKIQKLADALGVSPLDILSTSVLASETDLAYDELSLVRAWRKARKKDRRIVAAALVDYGFDYEGPVLHIAARGGKVAPLTGQLDPDEIERAIRETPSDTEE